MLSKYLSQAAGSFRTDYQSFPWSEKRNVWFALINVEDGSAKHYGFTNSGEQRRKLIGALNDLALAQGALLLGVWHGQHATHLFVIPVEVARIELAK